MEIKIISQNKNNILGREEYIMSVSSDKNPSKKELIEFLKSDESLTAIKKIVGSFGKGEFDVEIFVYSSKEEMDKSEAIPRKVRKKLAEEAKKVEEEKKKAEEVVEENTDGN